MWFFTIFVGFIASFYLGCWVLYKGIKKVVQRDSLIERDLRFAGTILRKQNETFDGEGLRVARRETKTAFQRRHRLGEQNARKL